MYVMHLTGYGLGYILGDFFSTKSSGRPAFSLGDPLFANLLKISLAVKCYDGSKPLPFQITGKKHCRIFLLISDFQGFM
jgi:hypothetical protein